MFLTRLAVRRPITTLMASLVVAVLGAHALSKLAIDGAPETPPFTFPAISLYVLNVSSMIDTSMPISFANSSQFAKYCMTPRPL